MRLQLSLTGTVATIATILIITGCSKNSSPPPQAERQKEEAFARASILTNSPDVLQKKFQENEKKIVDAQREVNLLRKKYNIHDTSPTQLEETNLALASSEEPYWVAKRTLANMIDFQKMLQAKITADKIDAQINAQAGQH
jgi:hypothetical protein